MITRGKKMSWMIVLFIVLSQKQTTLNHVYIKLINMKSLLMLIITVPGRGRKNPLHRDLQKKCIKGGMRAICKD